MKPMKLIPMLLGLLAFLLLSSLGCQKQVVLAHPRF